MTHKEAHRYHKQLWSWLAKHPDKEKRHWPGWKRHGYETLHYCFPCDLRFKETGSDLANTTCKTECMLAWPGRNCCTVDGYRDGLYMKWVLANGTKRTKLALKIRDLPLREEN